MIQLLRDAIRRVEALQRDLSRLKAEHVNTERDKGPIRSLVDDYFRTIRPSISIYPDLKTPLEEVDHCLQEALSLTHKRSPVEAYRTLFKNCKSALVSLESLSLIQGQSETGSMQAGVDSRIIETLTKLVPTAASAYGQALADLQDTRRASYRGPATDLREALRETLDHLAPDSDVRKQPGFKLEAGANGPTMKQKVRHVLSSRGVSRTLAETPERAVDAVEEAVGAFVRSVYSRSSLSTHTATNRDEVLRVRDWVRVAMCEILQIRGP
jgi:hypothetical protein